MICSWTLARQWSQTSPRSGPKGLFSRNTAPGRRVRARRTARGRRTGGTRRSGLRDQVGERIGRGPKRRCETVMAPGLLRVVDEVALGAVVGLLADDLDRVLVGAHRAVGAEAVEHRGRRLPARSVENSAVVGERQVRHVVVDADGEVVRGRFSAWQFVEHRLDHRRGEFLRREAVAAADDASAAANGD
jgi:hypothetical protein